MQERGVLTPLSAVCCHEDSVDRPHSKIDALYACCNAFYQDKGEDASTVSCPKYSLLTYVFHFSLHHVILTAPQHKDEAARRGTIINIVSIRKIINLVSTISIIGATGTIGCHHVCPAMTTKRSTDLSPCTTSFVYPHCQTSTREIQPVHQEARVNIGLPGARCSALEARQRDSISAPIGFIHC